MTLCFIEELQNYRISSFSITFTNIFTICTSLHSHCFIDIAERKFLKLNSQSSLSLPPFLPSAPHVGFERATSEGETKLELAAGDDEGREWW